MLRLARWTRGPRDLGLVLHLSCRGPRRALPDLSRASLFLHNTKTKVTFARRTLGLWAGRDCFRSAFIYLTHQAVRSGT